MFFSKTIAPGLPEKYLQGKVRECPFAHFLVSLVKISLVQKPDFYQKLFKQRLMET